MCLQGLLFVYKESSLVTFVKNCKAVVHHTKDCFLHIVDFVKYFRSNFHHTVIGLNLSVFTGVFFMGGASLTAKLVPSAKSAVLQLLPDIPVSSFVLPPVLLMGTHFHAGPVVTVYSSSTGGVLSKMSFLVLAIKLDKLPSPCDSSSNSLGSFFVVPGLFLETSLSLPSTMGKVPCSQGVLLSGQVGVFVAGSANLFSALHLDSGHKEGLCA
jgi:hypothetical protein